MTQTQQSLFERMNMSSIIDRAAKGAPPEVGEVCDSMSESLGEHLYNTAVARDAVKNSDPHPTLGYEPVQMAVQQFAMAVAESVTQGIKLYNQGGGLAAVGALDESESPDVIVAYYGKIKEGVEYDVNKPLHLVNLQEVLNDMLFDEDGSLSEKAVRVTRAAAKALNNKDADIRELLEGGAKTAIASPLGLRLTLMPVLTLGFDLEPVMDSVTTAVGASLTALKALN